MATNTFRMPMSNSRDAPQFGSDPTSFDAFFDDVKELASRANLTVPDTIKWAIRYAAGESESWKAVPCQQENRGDDAPALTFQLFKEEVTELYPNLSSTRRYTYDDLKRLLANTRSISNMGRDEFGNYHRTFVTYSSFLIAQKRLSERERSLSYLEGFPTGIRTRVLQRLGIKQPDVLPDDGYDFEQIRLAALFIFSAGSHGSSDRDGHIPAPSIKKEPKEQDSVSKLVQAVSDLTRVFTANVQPQRPRSSPPQPPPSRPQLSERHSAPGGAIQSTPRWSQPVANPDLYQQQNCIFCSSPQHLVRECPVANQYLQSGQVIKNTAGRIVLPDGRYPPRHIPGNNMQERVDNWWAQEGILGRDAPAQEVVSTNYLEGFDECVFQFDVSSPEQASCNLASCPDSPRDDTDEQLAFLQAQLDSLREANVFAVQKGGKKVQFDGVEIARRTGPPRRDGRLPPSPGPSVNVPPPTSSSTQPPPSKPAPAPTPAPIPMKTILKPSQPSTSQSSTSQPNPPVPNVFGRPGARAGALPIPRSQGPMRPVNLPPKPAAEDAKYRYQSAIENNVDTSDIANRVLDAKVTLSNRELLAVSADVRRQVKDIVTTKKVSANLVEVDDCDDFPASVPENDPSPSSVYFDLVKYDPASAAAASLPLRVIYPSFGPGVEPECILDGGAQVVVMRKDIWERLRAPIATGKAMAMESANATTNTTVGLIENHPVQLGPITLHLQIQVVEEAPFEVLLGRPFFDITSCAEVSRSGGGHELRVKDPSNGLLYVFATQPRPHRPPRPTPFPENSTKGSSANFHE